MKLAAHLVLLVAALGSILLIAMGPTCAFPTPDSPTRTVKAVHPSPSGNRVATVVDVSGGGAAGYVYQVVVLRSSNETDGQVIAERLHEARLAWLDDHRLRVSYSAGKPGRMEVDGTTISYHEAHR